MVKSSNFSEAFDLISRCCYEQVALGSKRFFVSMQTANSLHIQRLFFYQMVSIQKSNREEESQRYFR